MTMTKIVQLKIKTKTIEIETENHGRESKHQRNRFF